MRAYARGSQQDFLDEASSDITGIASALLEPAPSQDQISTVHRVRRSQRQTARVQACLTAHRCARQHAHRVKGAAGNLGMRGIQDTCELLEFNTREGAADAATKVGMDARWRTCLAALAAGRCWQATGSRDPTLICRCLEAGHDRRDTDGEPAFTPWPRQPTRAASRLTSCISRASPPFASVTACRAGCGRHQGPDRGGQDQEGRLEALLCSIQTA